MAEFKIETTQLKRCGLVVLQGRIDSSKAKDVEKVFNDLMDQGQFRFVVDMEGVEYISSGFLRVMISTLKKTKRWNRGDIYLAAMSPKLIDVFKLAGLLHMDKPMFQLFDTVAEAVGNW